MTIKIGINGFGRIGRLVFRVMDTRDNVECVGINDLADAKTLAHLLKYDSTHGRFPGTVVADGDNLVVNGKKIPVYTERDPAKLPWGDLGVDIAVESTGFFSSLDGYGKHLEAGAKKVLLSQPAKDGDSVKGFATVVMGVNEDLVTPEIKYLSNASCTTNCLAPMAKVLNDTFGIECGLITTIHAYTNDQRTLDVMHPDLRRARTAAMNLIPTSTGAARAVGLVIPELNGKLNGLSVRAPVHDGSLTDLVVNLKKDATVDEVNAALKAAAEGPMKGILEYCDEPIVSSDIIGNASSSIIDSLCTMSMGPRMIKVLSWYDNEWGFSNRMIDLMLKAHDVGYA